MATERRIVVEHADGRRVSVMEDQFDTPEGNPFNQSTDVHQFDANTGRTTIQRLGARPLDDQISLKEEGFRPVAYIHGETCDERCTHDQNVVLHAPDETCTEVVQLADGRTFTLPKAEHQDHLEDPTITVIHPGNEIALEEGYDA